MRAWPLALLMLIACASQPAAEPVPVRVVQQSQHCAAGAETARLYRLEPGRPLPGFDQPLAAGQQHWLLTMGQQPTGGYGLEVSPAAEQVAGQLTLRARWIHPPPGAIVSQALTRPCLLLALPDLPVEQVRVLDQHGTVRIEGPVQSLPLPATPANRWPG